MVQARMTTMAAPSQERASSSALAPVFFPALGSPLGSAGRALTSFAGGDDDGTFDYAEPLAARRGIVLLWLAPRTPEEIDNCHLFGVCNPVTGHRHVLPPLECSRTIVGRRLVGYAIITAADEDSSGNGTPPRHPPTPAAAPACWTFSQLLLITKNPAVCGAYLQSYSAATRCWSAPTRCLDRWVPSLVGARSAVVHHGGAHWLCVDERAARGDDGDDHHLYRLSVEVVTARISLTRLPVRVGGKQLLFVNSDGKLAVASVYPVHVTIWTPPGEGAGDNDDDNTMAAASALWPRTSFRIAPPHHHLHQSLCSFSNGSLFALFWGGGGGVFILDLDTKVMDEVSILASDSMAAIGFLAGANKYLTCVPCEMDLVEFFTLQLGGIWQRLSGTTLSETESS